MCFTGVSSKVWTSRHVSAVVRMYLPTVFHMYSQWSIESQLRKLSESCQRTFGVKPGLDSTLAKKSYI